MSLYLLLRRSSSISSTSPRPLLRLLHHLTLSPTPIPSNPLLPASRTFAFSSAEEAAAERRRRKRRLRIEPPLHAIQRNPNPPPRDPNAPPLPDSTSALVGPRLNLHNRVQSLIRASDLDAASHVARNSVYTRTRPTVFTCNAIIAAMYRAKRYNDAIALFKYFFEQHKIVPNVVSYNNLINTHCDEGRVDEGLEVYRHIIATAPFSPSSVTYRHLTKGMIDAGRIDEAVDLLREMLNRGHGADSLVYNNVIKGFLELGNLDRANEFFDELKERCLVYDGVVNATFMEWWFKQGKVKEAMESYKSLLDKKFRMIPATCNVLLEVLLKYEQKEQACALFEQMLDNHTPPNFQAVNSDTFNIMVNECFKEGKFAEAVDTFRKSGTKPGSKPFAMDVAGYNNMITRFCENNMLEEAEKFFVELTSKSLSPDVTCFRTLIDAFLKMERIDDALRFFDKMADAGLRVVASFGIRVFGELIKNGKTAESAQILTKMGDKDPKPDPSVYDVVVRGLCDACSLDTSKEILEQMMRYGVGVPPALKELVRGVFGEAGRGDEIESVLDERRWRNAYRPPHVQRQPRPQLGQPQREQSLGLPSIAGQSPLGQTPMARQQTHGSYQMTGEAQSVSSQIGDKQEYNGTGQQSSWASPLSGQQTSWSSQAAVGRQSSWSSQTGQQSSWSSQNGRQQAPWDSQQGGQQPSWSSQIGQQSTWSSQNGGQQASWNYQNGGQHPSRSSQPGQQSSWSSQNGGQQAAWHSENGGQQRSWSSQPGQQSSWSFQNGGQQSSWSTQNGGQQTSWDSQKGGQQPSWSSQTGWQASSSAPTGQNPSGFSQVGEQFSSRYSQVRGHEPSWSSQAGAQQPSWSSQIGGQQPAGTPQAEVQQHQYDYPQSSQCVSSNSSQYVSSNSSQYSYGSPLVAEQHPKASQIAVEHQWPDNQQQSNVIVGEQSNGPSETVTENHSSQWQENHQRAAVR